MSAFFRPGSFDVHVVCNSNGLRDAEKDYAKSAGMRRIAVLGDSYAWGHGVENNEMVSAVLQEMVPGAETLNFGVKGYSTVQEVLRLETEALRYEPDVNVLFFCWNDLEDNFDDKQLRRPAAVIDDNGMVRIVNRPVQRYFKSPLKQWFQRNSRIYGLGCYGRELLKYKRKEKRRSDVLRARPQKKKDRNAKKGKAGHVEFSMADMYMPPCPEMEGAWAALKLLLARARDLSSTNGGQLVVVYVAMKESMDRDVFAAEMSRAGLEPASKALDWDRPSNRLGDICTELGVPYVDLTPVFRGYPEPLALFLKGDAHWSPAGHRLAAQTIASGIQGIEHDGEAPMPCFIETKEPGKD